MIESAFAQAPAFIPESGELAAGCSFITGEFHFHCVPLYIGFLVKVIFGFAAGMCITNIIQAGFQIALGGLTGDKEKGKNRATWAVIGLVAAIIAFAMVDIVLDILLQ
jgi:hypothetical protein